MLSFACPLVKPRVFDRWIAQLKTDATHHTSNNSSQHTTSSTNTAPALREQSTRARMARLLQQRFFVYSWLGACWHHNQRVFAYIDIPEQGQMLWSSVLVTFTSLRGLEQWHESPKARPFPANVLLQLPISSQAQAAQLEQLCATHLRHSAILEARLSIAATSTADNALTLPPPLPPLHVLDIHAQLPGTLIHLPRFSYAPACCVLRGLALLSGTEALGQCKRAHLHNVKAHPELAAAPSASTETAVLTSLASALANVQQLSLTHTSLSPPTLPAEADEDCVEFAGTRVCLDSAATPSGLALPGAVTLTAVSCPNLEFVDFGPSPRIQRVEIQQCPRFLPECLSPLANLQRVELRRCHAPASLELAAVSEVDLYGVTGLQLLVANRARRVRIRSCCEVCALHLGPASVSGNARDATLGSPAAAGASVPATGSRAPKAEQVVVEHCPNFDLSCLGNQVLTPTCSVFITGGHAASLCLPTRGYVSLRCVYGLRNLHLPRASRIVLDQLDQLKTLSSRHPHPDCELHLTDCPSLSHPNA